jgi:4-alpha-glucanotransferase
VTAARHPQRWGVAPGFHDYAGNWRQSPDSTVGAVLDAMGAGEDGPPPPPMVTVRTDHQLPPLGPGRIQLEDGGEIDIDGPLPPDVPTGYHRFDPAEAPPHQLVVSPGGVARPERAWGFAAQLYAARSEGSWGIGDLSDLARVGRWARALGAGFTLVNPLHAPTPTADGPMQPSPYYPGSRCFYNPVHIAVEELPGAGDAAGLTEAAAAGRALNDSRRIDRDKVWALKKPVLRQIFERADRAEMDRYRARRGEALERFSTFCAVAETIGPDWRNWPEGAAETVDAEAVRFHSWLQMVTEGQLARAGQELPLVVDLAVGVDPSGPDSWIWQDCFAPAMRVGAPPDEFNTLGQNWGLPPFDPWRLRSAAYEPWIAALRSALVHGRGLRIDHVMGLFRLYWIPADAGAADGVYVSYPHHDLLNILALEAERAGAYVVGEDLGTVEDSVRADLQERGILSYRLWWFEPDPPPAWPAQAMGAVTTHDLPTVAGVLTGSDLQAQRDMGTEPNEESAAALLAKVNQRAPGEEPDEVIAGVYADLATSPCDLLVATLEDVLAVEERPNMPGTVDQWPNWCVALPAPLEELEGSPLAARVADLLGRGVSR